MPLKCDDAASMRVGRKSAGTPPGPPIVCWSTAKEMIMGRPCMLAVVTLNVGVAVRGRIVLSGIVLAAAVSCACANIALADADADADVREEMGDCRADAVLAAASFAAVAAFLPPLAVGVGSALRFIALPLGCGGLFCQ